MLQSKPSKIIPLLLVLWFTSAVTAVQEGPEAQGLAPSPDSVVPFDRLDALLLAASTLYDAKKTGRQTEKPTGGSLHSTGSIIPADTGRLSYNIRSQL